MDFSPLFRWLEALQLSQAIKFSAWMFPTIESLHVIAIALVFGVIAIVDLRLLGVASRSRRFTEVAHDCLHWTWAAFVLALLTGGLMFASNATTYGGNTLFWWKMGLLVLAGINMFIFELVTARSVTNWDAPDARVPAAARIAGLLSLGLWLAVIATGRWIGYTLYALPF
ncbi:DUF6644 family protein [Devosia ginsengisoli]|uniref:DUF6644 domain-containing protein n=1 Tax=Devosia ginsengisoli TaxID=400770 RepID=A0A5B8LNY9_9HYPH|nr:DUF6644 family protein [Devosia ginsengisoli]QDZ09781.1 hypothetical protein FPZ08_02885 [Devosia ginsengisoli]